MKITCKQQDLSRGLSAVSHAVSNRSTLPILSNILLATDQGRLKLSATNLEIGINCWVDAQIEEEGSTTVPATMRKTKPLAMIKTSSSTTCLRRALYSVISSR